MKTLHEKAMLVSLNIQQWSAKKSDKRANSFVEGKFNTAMNATNTRKALLAKGALSDINSIIQQAREFHRNNTSPWLYDGTAILSATNYLPYAEKMREFKSSIESKVRTLIDDYPQLVNEARDMLGDLFDSEDYPDTNVIASKFNLKVTILPLPSAHDFRVDLSSEELQRIQKEIDNSVKEGIAKAMQDLWNRLFEVVEKAYEKFSDPDAIFRDSLISNMSDLVELLPKLNICDDMKLERMRKEVQSKLCTLDTKDLRWDPDYRKDAAKDAKDIMDLMAGYMG